MTHSSNEAWDQIRRIANTIPQIIWISNAAGETTYFNDQWYTYTGIPHGELRREAWMRALHPDDLPAVIQERDRANAASDSFECAYRLRGHDDQYRWFLGRTTTVKNNAGRVTHRFGTATDINVQKLLEERLQENEQRLQEALRVRDVFLSIASHELKTPLTSLKLQIQMRQQLIDDGVSEAFSLKNLREILEGDDHQVDRLTRLIDDMLDISKISTGKLTMQPDLFDLSGMTRQITNGFAENLRLARCPVQMDAPTPIFGKWDRFRLEQVLVNLLSNATRYGMSKPIHVKAWTEGDHAYISVQDHGIGIAHEHQSRIFERYERAVSGSDYSGLGLGLFIAREIIDSHRGKIKVDSQLGSGSTFIVELPLNIERHANPPITSLTHSLPLSSDAEFNSA